MRCATPNFPALSSRLRAIAVSLLFNQFAIRREIDVAWADFDALGDRAACAL
jgi:hypothetical protein